MNASSNTYNAIAGLGTTSRVANVGQVSTTSAGLVTNAGNGAVNTSDKMTIGTTATNGYYQLTSVGNGKVNTGTGYITAGQTQSNDATTKYYVAKSTVTGHANSVTVSGKTVTYNINAVSTTGYTPGQTV